MSDEPESPRGSDAAAAQEPRVTDEQPTAQPRMLHPSSLLFQGVHEARRYLIPAIAAAIFATQGGPRMAVLLAVVFVIGFLTEAFRYITTRYVIRQGELIVWRGLFFRSERHVPTARIQNIDTVQNLLHRLFGVAEVRIETASGKEPEAVLRVLALREVEQLRSGVFGALSRDERFPSVTASEAARPVLLRLGLGDLVTAGLISNRGLLLVPILIGLFVEFDVQNRFDLRRLSGYMPQSLGAVAWIALAVGSVVLGLLVVRALSTAWYILRFFDYRMELNRDDLRIRCGLITRISATVPRRRIQFISVHRTLLGRLCGRAAIRIETAGGGSGDEQDAQTAISRRWFVPTIPEAQVVQLLAHLRPGVAFADDSFDWHGLAPGARRRLMRLALFQALGVAAAGTGVWWPWGWQAGLWVLPLLLYLAHLEARTRRYARTAWGVAYRSGILLRKESYTFFDKVQTVEKRQSPLDRRWHMATLSIDTPAAGPAGHRIHVPLLEEQFAEREAREVTLAAGAESMQWA